MMSAGFKIVTVAALSIGLALGVGVGDAQAASCDYGSGDTMWELTVESGYGYTATVTNLDDWGSVKIELWDSCWYDDWDNVWHCSGLIEDTSSWTQSASVDWYALDSVYYAWVDTEGNDYQFCLD